MLYALLARLLSPFFTLAPANTTQADRPTPGPNAPLSCGTPVNHVRRGHVVRGDGVIMGPTAEGVLVEWRTGGSSYVPRNELCEILP